MLPVWVNALLAAGAFLGLRHIGGAEQPIHHGGGLGEMVGFVGLLVAYYGQFLVPLIFVFGGIAGALGRSKRSRQFNSISRAKSQEMAIRSLSWEDFERMVGEAFRRQGYSVSETAKGADGGVDLVLHMGGERHLVQCKQWKADKVGVQVVRELFGIMAATGAVGGFVVASGAFTKSAHDFARGTNVRLVGGSTLASWFKPDATEHAPSVPLYQSRLVEGQSQAAGEGAGVTVRCPRCAGPMVPRSAMKGDMEGKRFLGCQRFPECRGTRQVD